ncbi:MAG: RNA polymerase sigma factor [Mangrovibacterium sp.]|jgi:RNA polymerase sigma-70 factor (ECF subfamily)
MNLLFQESLNKELRKGDPLGYQKLYLQTSSRLKNYCRLFLKNDLLIEDMVQNAYLRLWERRGSIVPEKSVESFLFRVVRNQCLNYLRDRKLEAGRFSIVQGPWSDLQHLYQIDLSGAEEKKLEEQLLEALKKAIDDLPERQNQIFVKCKIEHKKQKEVAGEMGITLKAVEKSLAKSKKQLREALQSRFPEFALMIFLLLD